MKRQGRALAHRWCKESKTSDRDVNELLLSPHIPNLRELICLSLRSRTHRGHREDTGLARVIHDALCHVSQSFQERREAKSS